MYIIPDINYRTFSRHVDKKFVEKSSGVENKSVYRFNTEIAGRRYKLVDEFVHVHLFFA